MVFDELGNALSNPITAGIGGAVGGALVGGVVGYAIGSSKGASSSKSKRSKSRRGISRDRKFISRQKHEQRYKRKKPGRYYKTKSRRKGVKYTKNGQPYIIMASGKARFIKKTGGKK